MATALSALVGDRTWEYPVELVAADALSVVGGVCPLCGQRHTGRIPGWTVFVGRREGDAVHVATEAKCPETGGRFALPRRPVEIEDRIPELRRLMDPYDGRPRARRAARRWTGPGPGRLVR